jgi:uncharacterized membrane protein
MQTHYAQSNGQTAMDWSERSSAERLATRLGWFSIGLGLTEVVAPGSIARLIGVRDEEETCSLLRCYGLREIASGVGILKQPRSAGWVWSRVAGDLLDLASLGSAMNQNGVNRGRIGTATAAVLGVTALDVLCAQRLSQEKEDLPHERQREVARDAKRQNNRVTKVITVNRSPDEVYRFWHDFANLPSFMRHLESVQVTGDRTSHWKAKGPAGSSIEWDAEITADQPNSLISWRSVGSADVDNSGSVRFEPATGGRGTFLRVELQYAPPGGAIAANMAKLFGEEPGQQVADDLRLFKQIMETGEVVKSDASIHRGMHPAQPSSR